jgi:hypothetical protein
MREHGKVLAGMSEELKGITARADEVGRRARELEAESGKIRRERLKPLWSRLDEDLTDGERAEVRQQIDAAEAERQPIQDQIRDLRLRAHELEQEWFRQRDAISAEQRTGLPAVIHDEMHLIEDAAAWDRLRLVRSAYLTVQLEAADRRPSAWWFPFLSRDGVPGEWYAEVMRRAEGYLEILCAEFLPEAEASKVAAS